MSRMNKTIALAALLMMTGCGASFNEVCTKAMGATSQLQSQLADAQRARSQLDKSGVRDLLPPDKQALYDKAVGMADEGYAMAVRTLATVEDVCSPPSVQNAITLIIKAWDILVPMLGLIGGTGTPNVDPPTVWQQARSAQ